MVTAVNLSVKIQNKIIIQGIDLTLVPGTFTAIVGPNGAGKSTLLRALSSELPAHSGHITINGNSLKSYTPRSLSMVRAVLPQHSQLQFSFTVEQVVMLSRHPHRNTSQENQSIVDAVLEVTGTTSFRSRNYQSLSGGEKQRVQLARVLAQVWEETLYPRYILLDEPTSSLDITQQQMIFSLAQSICSRNIAVMAIVHDLNQAVQFADQIYFMRNGKITASGDALKVFTKSNIEETFCCRVNVYHDPCNNCPFIVPDRGANLKLGVI